MAGARVSGLSGLAGLARPSTEYYDLTPRSRLQGEAAGREVEGSQRGRGLALKGGADTPSRQQVDKENVGNLQATPGSVTKAALKREQVVQELSQAQADARSRLCIFKSKGDALEEEEPEPSASEPDATPAPSERSSRAPAPRRLDLTVPQAPLLRTALRGPSRSLSARRGGGGGLSGSSTPLRGEATPLGRSRAGTPERSVRSARSARAGTPERSVRSTRSARSVTSTASAFAPSLPGRLYSTRPLTFPKGPALATEARSRSHSVGARTPSEAGTPERPARSLSVQSSRAHRPMLTVPHGPLLATELRSRSRSTSVYTCRSTRTPSAHSLDAETSVRSIRAVTVPHGPRLATELRSRSRVRTPSAHSVGALERSVRSCSRGASPLRSGRSCCSLRSASARGPPTLTVPSEPLLETQVRSWLRAGRSPSAREQAGSEALSSQEAQSRHGQRSGPSACSAEASEPQPDDDGAPVASPVSAGDQEASVICDSVACAQEQNAQGHSSLSEESSTDSRESSNGASTTPAPEPQEQEAANGTSTSPAPEPQQQAPPETESREQVSQDDSSPLSSLLDYLPVGSQAGSAEDATAESREDATAESRARSRKQEALAKLAEAQAADRRQRFVFRRPAAPRASPGRKTTQSSDHAERQGGDAGAQAKE